MSSTFPFRFIPHPSSEASKDKHGDCAPAHIVRRSSSCSLDLSMLFGYSLLLLVRWPCCVRDKTFLFSKRSVFCIFLFFFFKNKIRARREQGLGAVLGRNSHFDTTRRQSQKSEEVCVSHKGPTLDALWHSASELRSGTHLTSRDATPKCISHTHNFQRKRKFQRCGR